MSDNESIKRLTKLISAISNGKIEEVEAESESFASEWIDSEELKELHQEVVALARKHLQAKEFILNLSKGNLEVESPRGNRLVDPFKELQANLRHLVWQTHEIARGDYSQQIDFLGDFSDSFNSLVAALNEKKKIEKDLQENTARLKILLQTIPDLVWLKDQNGVYLSCNNMFERFFGAPESEIVGKTDYDFVDSDQADFFRENDLKAIQAGGPSSNEEWITFADDGHRSLFDTVKTPMFDSNGILIGVLGIARDITERKKAAEAISASEARLKRAELASGSGNWEYHLDSQAVYTSEGAKMVYGLNTVQMDYSFIKSIPLPEYRPLLNEAMKNLIEFDCPYDIEFKIKTADAGIIKDIHSLATFDKERRIVFGVIQDITVRKQTQETLRQSEEKFHSLYAHMIEGLALHTLIYNQGVPEDYRIVEINSAFESQLGISKEDVLNKPSKEAYGVEEPPFFEIYCRVALTGEPEIFETYFAPLNKYFSVSAYCPSKGSFATIFENITERKQAEIEKERTQKLLEDSQRIGKIGGWEINIDTMELNWTKEMYNIHEVDLSFKPTVDKRVNFYTAESLPIVDKAVHDAIEQGGSYDVDLEIITAKGNCRSVRTIGKTDLKSRRVFGFFQDITERKLVEDTLIENEARLLELNAMKDKFFSIIAHDLKSPFNSILGLSNMLVEQIQNKNYEAIEEYAGIIQKSSLQAIDLLMNLLEWSRSQTGRMEFSPEYIEMVALISEVIELFNFSAQQKSITIQKELPRNMLAFIDKAMISTILRNLLSNAIKFTRPAGQIVISAKLKNAELIIAISDNGVGIKKENIEKLFRIDVNHSTPGTQNEKGTGLGLILCKEFIEKHSGKIWVESEIGKGSIFYFSIPKY